MALRWTLGGAANEGRLEEHMAQEGTVKWFSEAKGYGFISPDSSDEEDVFVHYTAIEGSGFRSLEEGERVTYELTQGRDGRVQAANVRRARKRLHYSPTFSVMKFS